MIDLKEIRESIEDIKRNGTTVGQAEKLALLYIAADFIERETSEDEIQSRYSLAAPPDSMYGIVHTNGGSEFLMACNGAYVDDVLAVIDEHMEAIRILYPKEYEEIVGKIERLKE